MKIGVLTFHSQLNYGGVLQAYALQEVLRGLGHDAVIINRWLEPDNRSLELGYNRLGLSGWANVAIRSLLGGWEVRKYRRVQATKQFLREHIRLTPYHFVNWVDVPTDLGLDLIVVGSDQIWHAGDYSDPSVYLLEDAPKIPAIAYAVSFGMTAIPPECTAQYCNGLVRFSIISCRESEGVSLCRSLGFDAAHVVDPTLLLDPTVWLRMVKPSIPHPKPKLVCYLMDGNVPAHMEKLEKFSCQNDLDADVFLDGRFCLSLPKSISQLRERFRTWRIRRRIEAGPLKFVQAIADADFVLTDSFHALMFSCIFDKNARFLRPENATRHKMFARIEEFARECVDSEFICDNTHDALADLMRGHKIFYRHQAVIKKREKSLNWLKQAIAK